MTMTELKAGRELDALVAERVMGLVRCEALHHVIEGGYCHALPTSRDKGGETPCYSTSIAAAWLVVEKLQTQACVWDLVEDKGGWFATAHCYGPERHYGEWASTAPFSICLAALEWADSQ